MINKFLDKSNIKINKIGLQRADVIKTHGDNKKIKKILKFNNFTPIEVGIRSMIKWYKSANWLLNKI